MFKRIWDRVTPAKRNSQGAPTSSTENQEPLSPIKIDESFLHHLLRWRPRRSHPPANVLSPLPTVTQDGNSDGMREWVKNNISTILSILRTVPQPDVPTAFVHSAIRERGQENQPLYNASEAAAKGLEEIMGLAFRALDALDKLEANTGQPTSTPTGPTSSTRPTPTDDSDDFSPIYNFLASESPDVSEDFFRTDKQLLNRMVQKLTEVMGAMEEHSVQHNFAMSASGVMMLFLYELNCQEPFLDLGIEGTSIGFIRNTRAPTTRLTVKYMPVFMRGMAYGQRLKAQRDNDFNILDAVIEQSTAAVEFCTQDPSLFSPRALQLLSIELSQCLLAKYRATGHSKSLDDAISFLEKLTKEPSWSTSSIIGNAYLERFRLRGDVSDLDHCLQLARLHSIDYNQNLQGGTGRVNIFEIECTHLISLALNELYQQHEQLEDIEAAIEECQNAISRLPQSHFLVSIYKADLAEYLATRFVATARSEDIQQASENSQSALSLLKEVTPVAMPPKVTHGAVLTLRGAHNNSHQDLSNAISLLIVARKEFSGRIHLESHIEYHLSQAFGERYRLMKEGDDLDMALYHAKASLQKAEPEAPRRIRFMLHLGQLFVMAWEADPLNQESNISLARHTFRDILGSPGASLVRLQAALDWAALAEAAGDSPQALEALQAGLSVLPELVWVGHKMWVRYNMISSRSAELSRRATAHAIRLNNLEAAVVALEKGRSTIWSQALRPQHFSVVDEQDCLEATLLSQGLSRQAHDETTVSASQLREIYRQLVPSGALDLLENLEKFREVARQTLINLHPNDSAHLASVERKMDGFNFRPEMARYLGLDQSISLRSAAKRLEQLRGGAPPPELELQHNPHLLNILTRGNIVLLNIHGVKCDAIILSAKEVAISIAHIPLPNMSAEDANDFTHTLHSGIEEMYTDSITPEDFEQAFVIPVLQELWNRIVKPILERIGSSGRSSLPRIWWYPTGPLAFLPIHAAGPYTEDQDGLPELAISSYISSIQSLLRAESAPLTPFHMLAVAQPDTPGQPSLPAVNYEMKILRFFCQNDPASLTALVGRDADIHAVQAALPKHTWLHFSGHAVQDKQYPFDSALYLHDGPFKLAQLMQLDLSSVQFAFLSACMTSQGDQATPDENIHLAAGLQFAGARSVIATMWSVGDSAAALTSREVYKHLFRNGLESADPRDAAEALHIAMKKLKDQVPLYARVPIMHTGL